jgi:hypothetical protein
MHGTFVAYRQNFSTIGMSPLFFYNFFAPKRDKWTDFFTSKNSLPSEKKQKLSHFFSLYCVFNFSFSCICPRPGPNPCQCPCAWFKHLSMLHGQFWPYPNCMFMSTFMLHAHVYAACKCPCHTSISMLHIPVYAACPCPSSMPMSKLYVNVHAACQCSRCMSMSMLHVHICAAECPCWMSMSMLSISISVYFFPLQCTYTVIYKGYYSW